MQDKKEQKSKSQVNVVAQVCVRQPGQQAVCPRLCVRGLPGVSEPFVWLGLKGARLPGMTEISRLGIVPAGLPEGLHGSVLSPFVFLKQMDPVVFDFSCHF